MGNAAGVEIRCLLGTGSKSLPDFCLRAISREWMIGGRAGNLAGDRLARQIRTETPCSRKRRSAVTTGSLLTNAAAMMNRSQESLWMSGSSVDCRQMSGSVSIVPEINCRLSSRRGSRQSLRWFLRPFLVASFIVSFVDLSLRRASASARTGRHRGCRRRDGCSRPAL